MKGFPQSALQLRDALHDAGWSYVVQHGVGSDGSPFVNIKAMPALDNRTEINVTWHTRDTGTYRLFSCIFRQPSRSWRDVSLKAAMAAIEPVGSLVTCSDCGKRLDGTGRKFRSYWECDDCYRLYEGSTNHAPASL